MFNMDRFCSMNRSSGNKWRISDTLFVIQRYTHTEYCVEYSLCALTLSHSVCPLCLWSLRLYVCVFVHSLCLTDVLIYSLDFGNNNNKYSSPFLHRNIPHISIILCIWHRIMLWHFVLLNHSLCVRMCALGSNRFCIMASGLILNYN